MATGKHKFTVRWSTRNEETIRKIRERFNIADYTTINGWSPAEVSDEDLELFHETAKRGFFLILTQKWRKNGDTFSFISR